MACAINKTKQQMMDNGIIDKFNNLKAEDAPTISKFNRYLAYIKNLAIQKYGELPEAVKSPFTLQGRKVLFNNNFFDWVDGKNGVKANNTYGSKNVSVPKIEKKTEDVRNNVVQKMNDILKTLGITNQIVDGIFKKQGEINNLTSQLKDANEQQRKVIEKQIKELEDGGFKEGVAAQADITNQLILFSKGLLSEDNFTEETIHFVVEVLEQKDEALFNLFMDKIRGYSIYSQTLKDYQNDENYQKDGKPDYYKLKKEAIAKLITSKLLNVEDVISGDKGFFSGVWDKITDLIKSLFGKLPENQSDEFSKFADKLLNTNYVSSEDSQYLGEGQYDAKNKPVNINKVLVKTSRLFGKEGELQNFTSPKEARDFFVDMSSEIEKIEETDAETGLPITHYLLNGLKKIRVHGILEQVSGKNFKDLKGTDLEKRIREAKKEKGTIVHKTIEDIVARFIDDRTGLRRETALSAPANLDVSPEIYKTLEENIKDRLNSYPIGTYFATELKVVNEKEGYAGTIDFIAFLPNGKVDILDWKTTGMYEYNNFGRTQISDVNAYAQREWRLQIQLYRRALGSHGIQSNQFRYTRAIPIGTDVGKMMIDPLKGNTPDNYVITLKAIKIGNVDSRKIAKEDNFLLPVATDSEKTGNKKTDELIKNLWSLYERVQKTTYPDNEKFKKKVELARILSSIKELQIKGTASSFTNLFDDTFKRFNKLTKDDFSYLNDIIPGSGDAITEEQRNKVNSFLNEATYALQFLKVFDNFATTIRELYPGELNEYEQKTINNVVKITENAKASGENIISKMQELYERLAVLHNLSNVNDLDFKTSGTWNFFKLLMGGSHLEEKTLQFASSLNAAIKDMIQEDEKIYFDKNEGKFSIVKTGLVNWAKNNNLSIWKTYEKLLAKDKDGKYKSELLSKVKTEYYKDIDPEVEGSKRQEFEKIYSDIVDNLKSRGYKGESLENAHKEEYKKAILKYLEENYNLEEYKKDYEKALQEYFNAINEFTLDEDPITDEQIKSDRLYNWIDNFDVYANPKALSSQNYLLTKHLNEEKWYTEEYKNLLKPENKALLGAYKLFTGINERARKSGMLDDIFAYWKFVPHITNSNLASLGNKGWSFIQELYQHPMDKAKDGLLGIWLLPKAVKESIVELGQSVGVVENSTQHIDPLTGIPQKERPVYFKYAEKGQENNQSKDLLMLYEQWAKHVMHYDIITTYENRLRGLQLIESLKTQNYLSNTTKILNDKSPLKDYDNKIQINKNRTIEDHLERLLDQYIYGKNFDDLPAYKKFFDALYNYAKIKYLTLNVPAQIINVADAINSNVLSGDKWGYTKDALIGFQVALGNIDANLPKWYPDIIRKSQFLINLLNTRAESEYSNKSHYSMGGINFLGKKIDLSNFGMGLYGKGDVIAQDNVAIQFFLNTTIKDGKLQNISDLVMDKYKLYSKSLEEQAKLRPEIDKEISEMKRNNSLFSFVKEKEGKFTLEGIDLKSGQGLAEKLKYKALIKRKVEKAIGNPDEFDPSIASTYWIAKFPLQFKRWMPALYGNRLKGYAYDERTGQADWGRNNLYTSLFFADKIEGLAFTLKSVIPLLPFLKDVPLAGNYISTDKSQNIQDIAKQIYNQKKLEAFRDGVPFQQSESQFVDLYVVQLNNQMKELQLISLVATSGLALLAMASGDDKKKWYFKMASKMFYQLNLQLRFLFDPEQQLNLIKGILPVVTVANDIVSLFASYLKYTVYEAEELAGINKKKAIKNLHVADKTIMSIPGVRELHFWGKEYSADYSHWFNVKQPQVQNGM